jgi:hypothetical protein
MIKPEDAQENVQFRGKEVGYIGQPLFLVFPIDNPVMLGYPTSMNTQEFNHILEKYEEALDAAHELANLWLTSVYGQRAGYTSGRNSVSTYEVTGKHIAITFQDSYDYSYVNTVLVPVEFVDGDRDRVVAETKAKYHIEQKQRAIREQEEEIARYRRLQARLQAKYGDQV